jgi:GT2 family glycosyltransferase
MIYFFTPYSFEKKLFEAFDHYMGLVKDPEAWVCFLDGDTAFLRSDFGHKIKEYTEKYPDTGLFTCYASRCHYEIQTVTDGNMEDPSILFHKDIADNQAEHHQGKVIEINRRIAGHLMVIKKGTWTRIRGGVLERTRDKQILGVDSKISYAILNAGLKIRLMRSIYILHYLRMKEGFDYKDHLR